MADPNWWTFHGNSQRTGFTRQSRLNSKTVKQLKTVHELTLGGPVMSVPAIHDGFAYVGTANSHLSDGNNGGSLSRINLESGEIEHQFNWETAGHEGDTHGFTGMASTPAISDGRVIFSAFDGCIYCLDCNTLEQIWKTNLRLEDEDHNQPVTNDLGVDEGGPQAEGWCSPLIVNGRIYVGIGEGENPQLYSFLFCLNAESGDVEWIYCTCKYSTDQENRVNVLPAEVVDRRTLGEKYPQYEVELTPPPLRGASVWSAISYDQDLNRIYAATGNPTGEDASSPGPFLPVPGSYAYGILSLDADDGSFKGFYQIDPESSYRKSDLDVDFGASPIIFERRVPGTDRTQKVVAAGCKNGGLFVLDAETMECLDWCQILPKDTNGQQIPTVDPHGPDSPDDPNPQVSNEYSNCTAAENFHGTYSTPAIHPDSETLFIGSGGNNYHFVAAGIDSETTPFMRAYNWNTLKDAWELEVHDLPNGTAVERYKVPSPPMYAVPGEAGLSSPAVVNDVVFCSTSRVALYAFDVKDGTLLWQDRLGNQTGGFHGGYGYCMGPAISGDYVVAGALIAGSEDGGILRIYTIKN